MSTARQKLRLQSLENRDVPSSPASAPSLGPPPPASANVIYVSTVSQLQNAIQNLQSNRTIVIQPGTYQLTSPLIVANGPAVSNVLIRGATDNYNDVVIRGAGMDNSQVLFGFTFYNAQDVTVANLSVGAVYYHAIDMQGGAGAERIHLYHCRLFDAGEQLIKSNPGGQDGVDGCTVKYCLVEYTNGPSTVDHGPGIGYTNGISAIAVSDWVIQHNLFRNFHTPDNAAFLWNPVVLVWNHSQNTVVEGNTFIDSDRAIALGLIDQTTGTDHQGGIIRNNFVYQRPGLFSTTRRNSSDTQIAVYDSPGTLVYHNTVITSGNSLVSVEVRFANTGIVLSNNLADAPLRARDGGAYTGTGNYLSATSSMFVNAAGADFHLVSNAATQANVIDRAAAIAAATSDFDLGTRPVGAAPDVGADELAPPSNPPQVQSVVVNDGAAQRSQVTSLKVTFSTQVTFAGAAAAAFTVTRISDSAAVTFSATVDTVAGQTVVTLTNFTGTAAQFGSLADGRYNLTALATQISANGQPLDGNGNGTGGDNFVSPASGAGSIHCLFGDADGDGDVDATDFSAFRIAFGSIGQSIFDADNDGDVDAGDFGTFRVRFGIVI